MLGFEFGIEITITAAKQKMSLLSVVTLQPAGAAAAAASAVGPVHNSVPSNPVAAPGFFIHPSDFSSHPTIPCFLHSTLQPSLMTSRIIPFPMVFIWTVTFLSIFPSVLFIFPPHILNYSTLTASFPAFCILFAIKSYSKLSSSLNSFHFSSILQIGKL